MIVEENYVDLDCQRQKMVEEQSHNGGNIAEEENIREREFSFLQFGFRYFILHDCFLRNEECH